MIGDIGVSGTMIALHARAGTLYSLYAACPNQLKYNPGTVDFVTDP